MIHSEYIFKWNAFKFLKQLAVFVHRGAMQQMPDSEYLYPTFIMIILSFGNYLIKLLNYIVS